jgi:hypothetical protein
VVIRSLQPAQSALFLRPDPHRTRQDGDVPRGKGKKAIDGQAYHAWALGGDLPELLYALRLPWVCTAQINSPIRVGGDELPLALATP